MAEDLGARLVRAGVATREQLADALAAGPVAGGTLAVRLTERGVSEEELLGLFLADGFVLAENLEVPRDVLARIHPDMAVSLMALPLGHAGDGLEVAMVDPSDRDALHELQHSLGQPVHPRVARVSALKQALARAYPTAEARPSGPPIALHKRKEPKPALVEANDGEIVLPLVRTKSFKKVQKTFARPDGIHVPRAQPEAEEYVRPPSHSPKGLADEATQQLDVGDLEPHDASSLLAEAQKLGLIGDTTQELSTTDLEPLGLDPSQTEELDLNDVEVVATLLQKRKAKAAKPDPEPQPEPAQPEPQPEPPKPEPEPQPARAAEPEPEAPKTKPMPMPLADPTKPQTSDGPRKGPKKSKTKTKPMAAATRPANFPKPKTKSIIPPSEASWADLGAGFADSREGAKTVRQESNAREFDIGAVLSSIRASMDRDAIVRIACEACTTVARSAIFLALRKGVLRGWEGVGPGIAGDAIRNLWIPATAPSMFKTVLETSEPHRGSYGTSAADNLYRAATGSRGGRLIIQPVMVAGNIVAVLCADGVQQDADERVEVLAHAVGQALKRLIVAKKS